MRKEEMLVKLYLSGLWFEGLETEVCGEVMLECRGKNRILNAGGTGKEGGNGVFKCKKKIEKRERNGSHLDAF